MSSLINAKTHKLFRDRLDKTDDIEFAASLMAAYDRESDRQKKLLLGARIGQLVLQGVKYERERMKAHLKSE